MCPGASFCIVQPREAPALIIAFAIWLSVGIPLIAVIGALETLYMGLLVHPANINVVNIRKAIPSDLDFMMNPPYTIQGLSEAEFDVGRYTCYPRMHP